MNNLYLLRDNSTATRIWYVRTYVHVDLLPQDDDATSVLSGSGGAAEEQDEDGTYVLCLHVTACS